MTPHPEPPAQPNLPKEAVAPSNKPSGKKVLLIVVPVVLGWLVVVNLLGWQGGRSGGGERVSLSSVLEANETCPGYSDPPPCRVVAVDIDARSRSNLVIVSAMQDATSRWKVDTVTQGANGTPSALRLAPGPDASVQPGVPFASVGVRFEARRPGVGKITAFFGNCASPDTDLTCPDRTQVTVIVEAAQ